MIDALLQLISGKYFNNKKRIIECVAFLITNDFIQDQGILTSFIEVCTSQGTKAINKQNEYKNVIINAIGEVSKCLDGKTTPQEVKQEVFDFFLMQLTDCLEILVSQQGTGMLAES